MGKRRRREEEEAGEKKLEAQKGHGERQQRRHTHTTQRNTWLSWLAPSTTPPTLTHTSLSWLLFGVLLTARKRSLLFSHNCVRTVNLLM